MRLYEIVLFLFFTPILAGAAPDICSDLFSSSCVPGVIDDSTGSTVMAPRSINIQESANQNQIIENFLKTDLELARKQAGETLDLACNNGTKADLAASDVCDQEIRTKITELVNRRRLTGADGRYSGKELKFMEEFGFLKLLNQVQFGNYGAAVDIRAQEAKAAKLFPQIKEELLKKIRNSPLNPEKKAAVITQLNRAKNGGTDCGQELGHLSSDYLPKAFFNPADGRFFLCRNLLNQVNSEFALVTIIAHELAHSMDSCSLRILRPDIFGPHQVSDLKKGDAESPFSELINCLRSSRSVQAKNRNLIALEQKKVSENQTTFNYCDGSDQIDEATADWFASEIITDIISKSHPQLTQNQWRDGFRNTFRAKCDQKQEAAEFEEHPALRNRFNANVLANSAVRKKMGCGPYHPKVQCSFTGQVGPGTKKSSPASGKE